jgi:DNA-binding SARP family transcriptional activator
MEFRILGPLEVAEGGVRVELGAPKQRALLAVLLLHANEVVSRDRLVDELWGEAPPARAAKLVQHYVSGLRKVLPAGVLLTRAPGYLLRVEPGQLDLIEFERLLEEAKRAAAEGDVARAADLYRHALSLWRGPALGDAALENQAAREAAGLDDLRLAALVERLELELELGRHAELVGELEALAERYPYQERLRGQLMLALYRSGRQTEALEAYQRARGLLVDEFGLEPSHELQRLERAILQQDPSLDLPAVAARPAAVPEPVEPRRKTVTVLAGVLTAPQSDPEAFGRALSRAFAALAAAAEYHGGRAERLAGGELIAVFGVPEAHEDDALRALRAADGLRSPELRLGVATGEVLAEGSAVTGEPVAAAVRLAGSAEPGEVLATEATLALGAGAVEAEGSRVLAVAEGRPPFPQRTEAPLVGRDEELARLRELFAGVIAERRCRVVTLFGEAGIGKSRLGRELVAAVGGEGRVLVGRCVAYGEGATYLPLREALREVDVPATLAGGEEGELVAQRLAELTGEAEGAGTSGEGFWAVRRLLEALAGDRPLLLALEDVHWAEPTFLDLVEYLAEWSTEAPILVLCLARPELLDARPAWGGPTSPIASILLEPLTASESHTLVAALAAGVAEEVQARIARAAEGNPLYAEQLAAYAEESGPEALETVPPTIEALLASRLDRLTREERSTLERAAVVGREFTHGALVHLLPVDAAGAAGRHLLALARRGLVGPGRAPAPPGDVFRFHHVLIRDVAYAGIPKEARAELHERHADWLDERDGDDALVGYHLEQAHALRVELGERSGRTRRLALGAGQRLGAAGMRAWKQGDVPATLNLLGRSTTLLPEDDALCRELNVELGVARWAGGDAAAGANLLEETIAAAEAAHDRRIELGSRMQLATVRLLTDPEGAADELVRIARDAIPVLEELGDDRWLAHARYSIAFVEGAFRCRYESSRDEAGRALAHYQGAGWPVTPPVRLLAAAAFYGPTPAETAASNCKALLPQVGRVAQAEVSTFIAGLEAMQGALSTARDLTAQARRMFQEYSLIRAIATLWAPIAAYVEMLAGDSPAAERILLESCRTLERLGERAHLASQAGLLGEALYAQGRLDEADRWAEQAAQCAARNDIHAQITWQPLRAKLLALHGVPHEAESLARDAVQRAGATDALNLHAKALLDLAEVLRLGGNRGEFADRVADAIALYERKGNAVAAEAARARLAELISASGGKPLAGLSG